MEKQGDQIVETAVEARGGFLGRPVLTGLIASVAHRWKQNPHRDYSPSEPSEFTQSLGES